MCNFSLKFAKFLKNCKFRLAAKKLLADSSETLTWGRTRCQVNRNCKKNAKQMRIMQKADLLTQKVALTTPIRKISRTPESKKYITV